MRTQIFFVVMLLFHSCKTTAQKGESNNYEKGCTAIVDTLLKKSVYTHVDKTPEYLGGMNKMLEYFKKNFNPPDSDNFQQSFYFEFVIDVDGTVLGERIKGKNIKNTTQAEKEGLRVLKSMPKWVPGQCTGKVVPVKMVIPIKF